MSQSKELELKDVNITEKKEDNVITNKKEEEETSTSSSSSSPPNVLKVLWPAYLCAFVDFLGAGIGIPILPYYTLELPWEEGTQCPTCPQYVKNSNVTQICGETPGCGSSVEVGLTIFAFGVGQFVGNFFMSKLSDTVGRKAIIMGSIVSSALGYAWCGLATTLYSLLFARFFTGVAGGTMPVVQAMVLDTVGDPRQRPKYFGMAAAMLGLGFMLGPLVGGIITATTGNKRIAFFSPAIIAFICLSIGIFKIPETRPNGGICGPRKQNIDDIYNYGKKEFLKSMNVDGKAGSTTNDKKDNSKKNDGQAATTDEKMPFIAYICAACTALAAFVFACMTSMTGLVWMILFNFGPTELGFFLAGFGIVALIMNICGVKFLINKIGAPRTAIISCVLLTTGIAVYTFIEIFWIHAIFFLLTIGVGWNLTLPTLLQIASAKVPASLRGKCSGMVSASMSIGMAICPLISGPMFQSDIIRINHHYGSFSHFMWLIGGIMGMIELFLMFKYIGCARRLNLAGPATSDSSKKGGASSGSTI